MKRIKINYLIVAALLAALNYGTLLSIQNQHKKYNEREKNKILYFKIERMKKIVSRIPCINWKFKIEGPAKIEIFFKLENHFKKIFEYHIPKGISEYNHFDRSDKCFKSFNRYWNNENIKIYFYRITWSNPKKITTKTIVLK